MPADWLEHGHGEPAEHLDVVFDGPGRLPAAKPPRPHRSCPPPGSLAATIAGFCHELPSSRPPSAWEAARRLDAHLEGDDRPVPGWVW